MKHQTKQFCTHNTQTGFTLVELIITLAIAAIIMTQALPSFSSFIVNSRIITQTNDLVADINLARSEAIARGVRVVLCTSANSRAAGATCDGTAGTWNTGWLMFADDDGTTGINTVTDTLIRIGQPADSTIAIMANIAGSTDLQFEPNGTANEAGTVTFALCDSRGASDGRQINVNVVGRPRLISTSIATCTP